MQSSNIVRVVYANGTIGAFAGGANSGNAGFSGDGGAATSAALNLPAGLAWDGNATLYIADQVRGCDHC